MAMPLLRSRVSVIGGLDSRLRCHVSAASLIRLIRHDCPSRLRNESVSVVHTCRGGVLGT